MLDKEILTFQECCVLLDISESILRRLMKDKTDPIPFSYLTPGKGGTVRFLQSEVIIWLKKRKGK
jgi:predicted DNA-binding transcriptional regulator AlpA